MFTITGAKLAQFSSDVRESSGPLWTEIKNQYKPFDLFFGKASDPRVIAALAIKGFMSLLGIIFLCMVVYAGVIWMTAAGEEEKIRKAKSTLMTGSIGILIIFSAYMIASFIITAFGCATSSAGEWCLFFNNLTF
ncbi:MAG: hypothetical protein PHI63_06010 [Patescibacteria group bacterium]|nr:hypothetical protein [Patescibacteria group bacterium]